MMSFPVTWSNSLVAYDQSESIIREAGERQREGTGGESERSRRERVNTKGTGGEGESKRSRRERVNTKGTWGGGVQEVKEGKG